MSRRRELASAARRDKILAARDAYIEQLNAEMEQRQIAYLRRCIETVSAKIIPMEGFLLPYFVIQVHPYFDSIRLTKASAERAARRMIETRRRELKAELRSKLNTEEIR